MADADSYQYLSSNEESMDILSMKDPSKKSPLFRLAFALYTASPHLMILPAREQETIVKAGKFPKDYTQLDNQQRRELLKVAHEVIDTFKISRDIIPSIHVGTWKRSRLPFHARLCFGAEGAKKYLEIFDEMKVYSPMCEFWPSQWQRFAMNKESVNSHWYALKKSKPPYENIEEYHRIQVQNNTYNYKYINKRDFEAVVLDDLQIIPQMKAIKARKLKYHDSWPIIGLPWNTRHAIGDPTHIQRYITALYTLYEGLREQVKAYDHVEVTGKCQSFRVPGCEGGHICVSLGDEGFPGFDHSDGVVLGYVRISTATFYRVLPRDRRDNWCRQYAKWDGVVYT